MRQLTKRTSLFVLTFIISSSAFAQDCFEKVLKDQLQDYQACMQELEKDQSLRNSQKKRRLDLLERLIEVQKASDEQEQICYQQMINFFSQYGIKNLNDPSQDMGEELKSFWKQFLRHCPKIKEKSQ